MRIKPKYTGYNSIRLADESNAKERAFVEEWQRMCEANPKTVQQMLGCDAPATPAERGAVNTTIQWLGSPVGQAFIAQVNKSTGSNKGRE